MQLSSQIKKIANANGNKSTNDYDLEYLNDLTTTLERSWIFMLKRFGFLEKSNVSRKITQDLDNLGVVGMQYRYAIVDVVFHRLGKVGEFTSNGITLKK